MILTPFGEIFRALAFKQATTGLSIFEQKKIKEVKKIIPGSGILPYFYH